MTIIPYWTIFFGMCPHLRSTTVEAHSIISCTLIAASFDHESTSSTYLISQNTNRNWIKKQNKTIRKQILIFAKLYFSI